MKKLKKAVKKGFTLVELMIVVAIIGILAAIAIPNFIKFQAKSKQSEAKTNLKAVFTAEKSFFAEKDSYGTFTGAGFAPERGNRYAYRLNATAIEGQTRATASLTAPTTSSSPTYVGGGFDTVYVDCYRLVNGACTTSTPSMPTRGGTAAYADPTIALDPGTSGPSAIPGISYGASGALLAEAIGNVDNDAAGDVWAVGVAANLTVTGGVCTDAQSGPGGTPVNTWNDVNCD